MIVERDEPCVEWGYQDPRGGGSVLSIPLDIFLVFCRQAGTLEQLRCLCFAWPTRLTANAQRKAHAAGVGG